MLQELDLVNQVLRLFSRMMSIFKLSLNISRSTRLFEIFADYLDWRLVERVKCIRRRGVGRG
jgi:hypothetical protein